MPSLDLGSVVGPQGEQGATGAQGIRGEQGLPGPNQVTNSTATPLTGVLTGNGSVVGVANIDAAPTADSTGFAQSGGTDKAIKGRVPVYGMGKNLLRNWYFVGGGTGRGVFPVNQRGQSSYGKNSYSIDGWFVNNTNNFEISLTSSSLTLTSTSYTGVFLQYIPHVELGKQYTFSVLFSDGSLVAARGQLDDSSGYIRESFLSGAIVVLYDQAQIQCFGGGSYGIIAAKLELGMEQTLCHNEGTTEAPVWVLNEIPDYEYELYRCMTSTADSSDTYANKTLATGEELAYVENGTTASRAYTAGDYFCWHGLMYRARTNIGAGDTFTVNTNCILSSEGGLNALNNDRKYAISFSSFQWNYSADLDTFLSLGIYWIGSNATHSPTASPWAPLLVLPRGFSNPDTVMQILFLNDSISTRRLSSSAWTPWKTVALS